MDTKPSIHCIRRKRQYRSQNAPRAASSSQRTRRKDAVRIGKIVNQGHEYQKKPDPERQARDCWYDPVDRRAGRPREPEDGGRVQWASDTSQWQTTILFHLDPMLSLLLSALIYAIVDKVDSK